MRTLGQHAGIVVAGDRPFEIELGCYYAYALYILLSEGDHALSLRTDQITAVSAQMKIGFNPYYVPQFANVFGKPDPLRRFLNVRAPRRIVPAFRELILDYYQYVAEDQGKAFPVYFAEKVLPEPQARFGIRAMFGNTREIVLVRDARDVLCSFMASGGLTFEQALANALSAATRYLEIKNEQNASIHFVRYEDYVLDQANVIAGVLDFLGLPASRPDDQDGMATLFQVHGTSATPEASIARWQRDLKPEQLAQMDGLKDFLATFGYET
jgi:hypothetical protein